MSETYEQIRSRHERELEAWVRDALKDGTSVNAAARRAGVNAGTFWRLARRFGHASDVQD